MPSQRRFTAILFQPILLLRPSADHLNQSFFAHLPGQQVGPGFLDMKQLLQLLVAHFTVFFEVFENRFHLRRNDRCGGLHFCRFCARRSGVHVWQHDSKCICRCLDAGLDGAACIELENAADAGAVAFNQAQAVKNLCQLFIPRLRNAEF